MFGKIFNDGTEFARDGSQFDRLFSDGDSFSDRRPFAAEVLHARPYAGLT